MNLFVQVVVRTLSWILGFFPLEKLKTVFAMLAKKVLGHRLAHNGFVPREVFEYCIAIGGGYLCAEIVVAASDGKSYWLKLRDSEEEAGWKNKYQITGVAIRATDSPWHFLSRLYSEIFGDNFAEVINSGDVTARLVYKGIETHDESEEGRGTCWTAVWLLSITEEEEKLLDGTWTRFSFDGLDNEEIVVHHGPMLEWVTNPAGTKSNVNVFPNGDFVDLRPAFKKAQ